MSATIHKGSARSACNQDKQKAVLVHQASTDTLQYLPMESNGGIPVNIQDQTTRAFDLYFSQNVGSATTLLADSVIGDYSCSCTTGHGLEAGDYVKMADPVSQAGFTGGVVSVAGNNTVNVDRPFDRALLAASTVVQEVTYDMDVNGAITRQTFSVGGGAGLTAQLDIVRFMFQIVTTNVPTFNVFGDLATALTRGVIMQVNNGNKYNLWNVRTNGDMAQLMYDFQVYEETKFQGVNGMAGRLTYGSPGKHGVTLRIGGGDSIDVIIQDDLTNIVKFRVMAQGHIVTD